MDMPRWDAKMITRLVLAVIGVINVVLMFLGKVPVEIAESTLYVAVSAVYSVVTTGWVAWKDNDLTKRARIRKLLGEAALAVEDVIEDVLDDLEEVEPEAVEEA
jgi:SPP1 family holin